MKITANIATQPSRLDMLVHTIYSLYKQVDEVRVYCNEMNDATIKAFIDKYQVSDGQSVFFHYNRPNIADNGKFAFVPIDSEELYFCCDDDIIYPKDYVEVTKANMLKHPGHIITYHGRILRGPAELDYYHSHDSFKFNCKLDTDTHIDVAGTGVTAFSTVDFKPINIKNSQHLRMSDLLFSMSAAQHRVPIMCCTHNQHWFGYQNPKDTILSKFDNQETPVQNKLAQYIYMLNHDTSTRD